MKDFRVKSPPPQDWNIGLIVGRSGSGKTTIARELFETQIIDGFEYTHESLLDDMPKGASVNDICMALTAVGFSSPPSWLKSYHVLSNGEKMRCDIARAMLQDNEMFVFDEFTSVVDRNVAQIASYAIQKAIRRKSKKFIAVTCHYDVQDWLMPDWVFNTDDMTFRVLSHEEQKKNRPAINLRIYETNKKEYYWSIFRKHHYLNHSFNKAAKVFVAEVDGNICGFCATLPFPSPVVKKTWREHRTVVLPDYQGVGIGGRMTEFVAEHMKQIGYSFISTTSNPAMINARVKSEKWIATHHGRKTGKNTGMKHMISSINRITVSFKYKSQTQKIN